MARRNASVIPDIIIISAKKKQTFVLGFWERPAISASQLYTFFLTHLFSSGQPQNIFTSLSSPVSSILQHL